MAKFLSDGGNQFAERERQPGNVAAGFDQIQIPSLYQGQHRHFRKYKTIETIITCHGNRSSQCNETGGNIGKVGKDFEGEGGQDERQAPHQDMS